MTLLRAVTHVCVGVGEPPSSVTAHLHRNTSGWTPDNRQNVEQPSTLTSSLRRSAAAAGQASWLHCTASHPVFVINTALTWLPLLAT